MSRVLDVYREVEFHTLYRKYLATPGSGAVVGTAARNEVVDAKGFEGVATAYFTFEFDANVESGDNVVAVVQKCTDTAGSNATAVATADAVAGDGAAKTYSFCLEVPLYSLGEHASAGAYRYLRASLTITDANSGGSYTLTGIIALPGKYKLPVAVTAEES